jgi:hypothetical protein
MYMLWANPGADIKELNDIKNIIQKAWQVPATADSFREKADMEIDPARVLDVDVLIKQEFVKYRKLAADRPEIVVK